MLNSWGTKDNLMPQEADAIIHRILILTTLAIAQTLSAASDSHSHPCFSCTLSKYCDVKEYMDMFLLMNFFFFFCQCTISCQDQYHNLMPYIIWHFWLCLQLGLLVHVCSKVTPIICLWLMLNSWGTKDNLIPQKAHAIIYRILILTTLAIVQALSTAGNSHSHP